MEVYLSTGDECYFQIGVSLVSPVNRYHALSLYVRPCVGVVEQSQQFKQSLVVGAALDADHASADGRAHHVGIECLRRPVCVADPGQPGAGKHQGVKVSRVEPEQPGVDVAAYSVDRDVRAVPAELRLTADGRCSDPCPG